MNRSIHLQTVHFRTALLAFAVVVATGGFSPSVSATTPVSKRLPETVVATTRSDNGNGKPVRITVSSAEDVRSVRQVVSAPSVRGSSHP